MDSDDSGLKDDDFRSSDGSAHASAISRKQFRETIGNDFARDLLSGEFSYDEIIRKYKETYPQYADKFTRNFCSKVRCGRILNTSRTMKQRSVKNGDPRMKRVSKISKRKEWTRMTPELYARILQWEHSHNGIIKQSDIEQKFNINRSTYHRWKKKCSNPGSSSSSSSMSEYPNNMDNLEGDSDSDMDGYDPGQDQDQQHQIHHQQQQVQDPGQEMSSSAGAAINREEPLSPSTSSTVPLYVSTSENNNGLQNLVAVVDRDSGKSKRSYITQDFIQ